MAFCDLLRHSAGVEALPPAVGLQIYRGDLAELVVSMEGPEPFTSSSDFVEVTIEGAHR